MKIGKAIRSLTVKEDAKPLQLAVFDEPSLLRDDSAQKYWSHCHTQQEPYLEVAISKRGHTPGIELRLVFLPSQIIRSGTDTSDDHTERASATSSASTKSLHSSDLTARIGVGLDESDVYRPSTTRLARKSEAENSEFVCRRIVFMDVGKWSRLPLRLL